MEILSIDEIILNVLYVFMDLNVMLQIFSIFIYND